MKDYDRLAKIEQAIAKKYGHEAIENPRKYWNDEKEKKYQEQLKKLAKREAQYEDSQEKVEVDGVLISKKLLIRETIERSCPVCEIFSFSMKDDFYMSKYDCCYNCFIQWVDQREERWSTGWRPKKENL